MRALLIIALVAALGVGIHLIRSGRESVEQGVYVGEAQPPDLEQAQKAVGVPGITRGSDRYSAGTGSVISLDGRNLILVAFHIFIKRGEVNDSEQARVDKVSELLLVGASRQLIARAGRALKMPGLSLARPNDATEDFVFFEVLDVPPVGGSLPLAASPPLKGTPVWVVGQQGAAAGKVAFSSDRRLEIQLSEPAPAGKLSGAPVINGQGQVVGAVALGGRGSYIAVPLQALRDGFDG